MNEQFENGQQVKVQLYQNGELYPARVVCQDSEIVIVACAHIRTWENYSGIVDVDVESVQVD